MKQKKNDPDVFDIMRQKKNYWTWCKACDEYHTFEEVPCFIDPNIPQLPALPKDERGSSYYWNLEKWV